MLVPVPEPGQVILIRQYRYAVNAFLWELPAGSVDEGESPEAGGAARVPRGDRPGAGDDRPPGAMYPTPGYCDEEMVFFRCRASRRPTRRRHVDEDEDIEAKVFELREARDMVRRGEIVDMKTLVGLALI